MAIARSGGNGVVNQTGNASTSITGSADALAVVAGIGSGSGTSMSIGDTRNWGWNEIFSVKRSSGAGWVKVWWAKVPDNVANTITVSQSPTTWTALIWDIFTGTDVTNPLDASGSNYNDNSSAAIVQASCTPTVDNCLMYAACCDTLSGVGASWSAGGSDGSGDMAAYVLDSGTAGSLKTTGFTSSGNNMNIVVVCSLKPVGAVTMQKVVPDADVTTTGWSTAPLFSKTNDASDATVITATLA